MVPHCVCVYATSAGQPHKDQNFLLLRLNIVNLQVHFSRHFERVFRHRREKVGALDSSACTQHTELCGHIWYMGPQIIMLMAVMG